MSGLSLGWLRVLRGLLLGKLVLTRRLDGTLREFCDMLVSLLIHFAVLKAKLFRVLERFQLQAGSVVLLVVHFAGLRQC